VFDELRFVSWNPTEESSLQIPLLLLCQAFCQKFSPKQLIFFQNGDRDPKQCLVNTSELSMGLVSWTMIRAWPFNANLFAEDNPPKAPPSSSIRILLLWSRSNKLLQNFASLYKCEHPCCFPKAQPDLRTNEAPHAKLNYSSKGLWSVKVWVLPKSKCFALAKILFRVKQHER